MIRALVIGTDAERWSSQLAAVASGAEFVAERLPAAAIRAFERSPADVVVLCGELAGGRLSDVLDALRDRPLGRTVPCLALCAGDLEGVDERADEDVDPAIAVEIIARLLGMSGDDLRDHGRTAELTGSAVDAKLRQVRHGSYFEVLEVAPDATPDDLRIAFARLCDLYDAGRAALGPPAESKLAEVRDGIEDAFAVLSDEKLRTAYCDLRRTP